MAVTNPQKYNLTAYAGNTFAFLFTFSNDAGTDIALATDYTDITFRVFKYPDSPKVEKSVSGGGLTIANTNELSGDVTAANTESLFGGVLHWELEFELANGDTEVYLYGRFLVNNYRSGGEQSAELAVTINQTTNAVTISEATNSAAAAARYASDAEASKTAAQTAETNAQTAATNASKSASNAATSATNAANSATEAQEEASDAEKQAQNTTSFTDSDGNTFGKGAKGYANDAQASANNAASEVQEKRVDDSGFYANELLKKHNNDEPLWLPEVDPADVITPPSGTGILFFDSTNSNALSKKDSSGTTTPI